MPISLATIGLISLAAFLIGLSKGGIKGIDVLNFVLLAFAFGSKPSTGIILPMLFVADIFATFYYKMNVNWVMLRKLIIWLLIGIPLGAYLGKSMDEAMFKKMMALIILVSIGIIYIVEIRKVNLIKENRISAAIMGLTTGFVSMIGNLAGAFANLYFLSLQVKKDAFIGTTAVMFLIINFVKLPFQMFYWRNITYDTLLIDLYALPGLIVGFYTGLHLVKKIKDDSYRKMVLIMTLIGALVLLIQ
jgi:uncharacterized protein